MIFHYISWYMLMIIGDDWWFWWYLIFDDISLYLMINIFCIMIFDDSFLNIFDVIWWYRNIPAIIIIWYFFFEIYLGSATIHCVLFVGHIPWVRVCRVWWSLRPALGPLDRWMVDFMENPSINFRKMMMIYKNQPFWGTQWLNEFLLFPINHWRIGHWFHKILE